MAIEFFKLNCFEIMIFNIIKFKSSLLREFSAEWVDFFFVYNIQNISLSI